MSCYLDHLALIEGMGWGEAIARTERAGLPIAYSGLAHAMLTRFRSLTDQQARWAFNDGVVRRYIEVYHSLGEVTLVS